MSSNEPEMEVQVRRHIGPLVGIAAVALFAAVLFVIWMFYEVDVPDEPVPAEETTTATGSGG